MPPFLDEIGAATTFESSPVLWDAFLVARGCNTPLLSTSTTFDFVVPPLSSFPICHILEAAVQVKMLPQVCN